MKLPMFYTPTELAENLKVNVMTIYRYIEASKLKAYKIGKEYRIDDVEFERFMKEALARTKARTGKKK